MTEDPGEQRNLQSEAVPWTRELLERHADVLRDAMEPRVAPGQAVVCYAEDEPECVMGGGGIE